MTPPIKQSRNGTRFLAPEVAPHGMGSMTLASTSPIAHNQPTLVRSRHGESSPFSLTRHPGELLDFEHYRLKRTLISIRPTIRPSDRPFVRPSDRPTDRSSVRPTDRPTVRPSVRLSVRPSVHPSVRPTDRPSVRPSVRPFDRLTGRPAVRPY